MKIKTKYKPELICSKDHCRPSIHEPHIGVVRNQTTLSATDGRRLVVVPVEADESEYGYMPKEALQLARQKREDKKQDVISLGVNGCITLANGWTLPRPKQSQLKYPNVDMVIPEKTAVKISFSAKYLHELAQAMGVDVVSLSFDSDTSPILVTAQNEPAYGVLMPVRVS